MKQACICNRLAKIAHSSTRKSLYQMKDENIRMAMSLDPDNVVTNIDHNLHYGLLTVQHKNLLYITLHTHENWLGLQIPL